MAEVYVGGNLLQQAAVTGREPNLSRSDQIRALAPLAARRQEIALRQEELDRQRRFQEQQQQQQTVGNVIQGVGTVGQVATTADDLGLVDFSSLFGGGTTTAPATVSETGGPILGSSPNVVAGEGVSQGVDIATTSSTVGTSPALAGVATPAGTSPGATALGAEGLGGAETVSAGGEVTAAGGGVQGGEAAAAGGAGAGGGSAAAGSTATAGALGDVGLAGAIGGGVGAGVVGAEVGTLAREESPPALTRYGSLGLTGGLTELLGTSDETNARIFGAAAGSTVGAALGFVTGGYVGLGIGGALGAAGGAGAGESFGCIIVTAAHGRDSEEVQVARAYRDSKMSAAEQRGYYMLAEPIAKRMEEDETYKEMIRNVLVAPLIKYGRFVLGMPHNSEAPTPKEVDTTHRFLDLCRVLGQSVDFFVRQNGEDV